MGAAIPLREIATPSTALGRREVIIANAKSMIGLSAWSGNPAARAEFEDILGPLPPGAYWDLDRPFHVNNYETNATEGVSTCGLVVRGNQRRSGVADPNLWLPYEAGTAFSGGNNKGFLDFARNVGAYKTDWQFFPGCYIVIGSGLMTHTFTCIGIDGDTMYGADGGATDKAHGGLQCVDMSTRSISSLQYVCHVNPDLLPFQSRCLVPPNYAGGSSSTLTNVATLAVFAGLGYLLARKYGPDILKRAA